MTRIGRVLEIVRSMDEWTIARVPVADWHSSMTEKLRLNHKIAVRLVAVRGEFAMVARVPLDVKRRYVKRRTRCE